ncbi:MAG: circadian clock KaiB family protein [Thermoguttaceae bacterium]|nr:circadian clock KaiB family protein [Thermoguttaceae bacterium]
MNDEPDADSTDRASEPPDRKGDFEALSARRDGDRYRLRLYVTGMTARSIRAIANLKAICEEWLPGRYDLEVLDIHQHPEMAREQDVIAAPTLVKELPPPLRRLIGDLSNSQRVLAGLGLEKIHGSQPTDEA